MPAIKPMNAIREKWERVTPQRSRDYELGVQSPRRDWAEATADAKEAWEQGITDAIANNRWERGVRRTGTARWKQKTLEKGPIRWQQGVRIGADDYQRGFAPYRDAIENLELPPRQERGNPANLERVRLIAQTLHELKRRLNAEG